MYLHALLNRPYAGTGNTALSLDFHYTDAAGASSWQKPVDFLTKGGMTGDCTDTTNAEVSMLRSLGYPAKAVFGYQIDVDHAHAWAEVMVNGGGWAVVRPRQSFDALIGMDRMAPWLG